MIALVPIQLAFDYDTIHQTSFNTCDIYRLFRREVSLVQGINMLLVLNVLVVVSGIRLQLNLSNCYIFAVVCLPFCRKNPLNTRL